MAMHLGAGTIEPGTISNDVKEIQTIFGIEDEELNLDLGPLGNLL